MNVNEVCATLASRSLGGGAKVHPNDAVNLGQSSNDVVPSALHVAAALAITRRLLPALAELEGSLRGKSVQFWGIVKTGRTHMQDAVPIRLGQAFGGYADQVALACARLVPARDELLALALGGTAVGTGLGAAPGFGAAVAARLAAATGLPFAETGHHFAAQGGALDGAAAASGGLAALACALTKVANDVRWMGSGPRAGLGELVVPAVQPGSSIMPGKARSASNNAAGEWAKMTSRPPPPPPSLPPPR